MVPESTMMVYLLCGVVEILVMVGWFTYYWGCLAFGDLSNQSIRAGVVDLLVEFSMYWPLA